MPLTETGEFVFKVLPTIVVAVAMAWLTIFFISSKEQTEKQGGMQELGEAAQNPTDLGRNLTAPVSASATSSLGRRSLGRRSLATRQKMEDRSVPRTAKEKRTRAQGNNDKKEKKTKKKSAQDSEEEMNRNNRSVVNESGKRMPSPQSPTPEDSQQGNLSKSGTDESPNAGDFPVKPSPPSSTPEDPEKNLSESGPESRMPVDSPIKPSLPSLENGYVSIILLSQNVS